MKKMVTAMYIGIILFVYLGLFFCGFYAPHEFGLFSGEGITSFSMVELAFYWACSLPCFIVLVFALKITKAIEKDAFFTSNTVINLKRSGYILLIDSAIFLVVNIVYASLRGALATEVLLAILSLVGTAIGVSLIFACEVVKESKQFKDDAEGII